MGANRAGALRGKLKLEGWQSRGKMPWQDIIYSRSMAEGKQSEGLSSDIIQDTVSGCTVALKALVASKKPSRKAKH